MEVLDLTGMEGAIEQAERESAFWAAHLGEYRHQFPDQFIAVRPADGEVVAVAPDLQTLDDRLRGGGLTPSDVWTRFVAPAERQLIL